MSDIFREVDEALQQDKAARLWKEYGSTLITAAVVMVMTTALFTGVKSWNAHKEEKRTSAFLAALKADDPVAALEDVARTSPEGIRSLALFAKAGALLAKNDVEGALTVYETAIADKILSNDFEDLARVMVGRFGLHLGAEKREADTLLKAMAPVLKKPKSPWYYHALVETASVLAHRKGDFEAAGKELDRVLNAADAPADLKDRAKAMAHVFAIESAKTKSQKGS